MISPASCSGATAPSAFPRRAVTVNPETIHDAQLVNRFNAGDEAAFAEIVARYREKMFSLAFSLLRNRADAEEIAQDVFIRAYRGLARFRGDSSLATWLHCIVLNLARNRYWYFFRRRRHDTQSLDCTFGENGKATFADLVACEAPDPAREVANDEFSAHVTLCMGKLNAAQREILTMRNFLGRSYEEIATTLGLRPGTVKSRIARARHNLRELLAETYAGIEPGSSSAFPWFETSRPAGHLDRATA